MEKKKPSEMIPNFEELYNCLLEFIKEHQGEKGYIVTDRNGELDNIYGLEYDKNYEPFETKIYAVRVNEDNFGDAEIEFISEAVFNCCKIVYSEEDFKDEDNWLSLKYSDVEYVRTLLNIAEFIEEYV